MSNKIYIFVLLSLSYTNVTFCQNTMEKQYEMAANYSITNLSKHMYNLTPKAIWIQDGSGVIVEHRSKNGNEFLLHTFDNLAPKPLFDRLDLAKKLEVKSSEITSLNLYSVSAKTKDSLKFSYSGKEYEYKISSKELTEVVKAINKVDGSSSISPDSMWEAFTKDYNIYIKRLSDGQIKQVTFDGKKHYEYGTYYGWADIIEGENGNRPDRYNFYWSPDSKWLSSSLVDFRTAEKMYLLDHSIDTLFKPKLLSYYRASPGDTTIVKVTPFFYDVTGESGYTLQEATSTHTNPNYYLWTNESGKAIEHSIQRGYKQLTLRECDFKTKTNRIIYKEESTTNIDNFYFDYNKALNKIVVLSERSGWRQLYVVDVLTTKLVPITKGEYFINDIIRTDWESNTVFFTASGKEKGVNPYQRYLYKCSLLTGKTELLTSLDGNHDIDISPNGKWYMDNYSTMSMPNSTYLRSTSDVKYVQKIASADISFLKDSLAFRAPEQFTAIGRDGITTIYGAMWKPTSFDERRSYPIIDQTYTGPHTYMFPTSFNGALARSNQALAELGFLVVCVDGLGTANRSKAFHNVSYKNMGNNLIDHKLAILQLARKYSWIDSTRVGIFGHSAGGYDAGHALLAFPEFYKVGVASSADHDFRMEKAWWPEMYMGWPVDSSYHYVSNITMASNLKGKLLITHGGIDENVNPSATFKLADALIKADKEFDMLILPSQRHGYAGDFNVYFIKKKWNYFVKHLLNKEPIWDFELIKKK